jgi:DNA-binding NtrC family response regulator
LAARLFGAVEDDGSRRPGAVHASDGGTLIIEDIDALPLSLQSSLLRLLSDGEVTPRGSAQAETVDVRIVATTTADLGARVQEDRFQRALRDRLRVMSVHVPPLRERRADIPLLVRHFLNVLRPTDEALVSVTQPALEALLRYNWPGNVRQLRNEIERALVHVQSEPAPTIDLDLLLDTIVEGAKKSRSPQTPQDDPDAILEPDQTLNDVLSRTEKAVIERVLRACDGQVTASADVLGLTRQGLYKKMKRLDIDASAFQPSSEPTPA